MVVAQWKDQRHSDSELNENRGKSPVDGRSRTPLHDFGISATQRM